ncbi:MAG: YggS family pyridoxal phosphate-dependent enzyme [Peptostreptococcaceae bacterium]|jgi:pyridoxal phosphate enzyme, yggS family|nr:YggS family pyridoxal phosphate-dependent enzyme [Peptostreptococcaceae bacterium]
MEQNIAKNLRNIQDIIGESKSRSPYKQDVTLVAVSKTVDVDKVKQAIDFGICDFGENKPQELVRKYDVYPNVRWHQIGTLQKNKVKNIIDKAYLIHSVDSIELCEYIDKKAKSIEKIISCLLQVNISEEISKHGFIYNDVLENVKIISEKYTNIKVDGLMGMAPYLEDREKTRIYFKRMKELFENINSKNINNLKLRNLSMGMSNDFDIAIQEGSTIVRVGTSIFGERIYI